MLLLVMVHQVAYPLAGVVQLAVQVDKQGNTLEVAVLASHPLAAYLEAASLIKSIEFIQS